MLVSSSRGSGGRFCPVALVWQVLVSRGRGRLCPEVMVLAGACVQGSWFWRVLVPSGRRCGLVLVSSSCGSGGCLCPVVLVLAGACVQ